MSHKRLLCANHTGTNALYRCSSCQKTLCLDCVRQEKNLFFCKGCNSYASLLESTPEIQPYKETVTQVSTELRNLILPLISHIILPAALIIMVGAFLFFLLDVRSVYFADSAAVRRVAFFFCAATVLISRFGMMYPESVKGRQMLYTLALAFATALVMLRFSQGTADFLVNTMVVGAVWWLATRITKCLDIGEEETDQQKRSVFGSERLQREEVHRKLKLQSEQQIQAKESTKKVEDPSLAVARLAIMALIAFALGEPVLLSGPPEAGMRAMAAVVVFLLSTGVVMSTGAALHTFRRANRSGGTASLDIVLGRLMISFFLLVVILSVTLTIPGITYRGSGTRTPRMLSDTSSRQAHSDRDSNRLAEDTKAKKEGTGKQAGSASDPGAFFNLVFSLGKWLLWPLALLSSGLFIYALVKLWPSLKGNNIGIRKLWKRLLDRLRSILRLEKRVKEKNMPAERDILKMLDSIPRLAPREAIISAYTCLQEFLSRLDYTRTDDNTPYEILRSLPRRFEFMKKPMGSLTDLYVSAAYSSRPATPEDRNKALKALFEVKGRIESYQNDLKSR
jgi:hypothetical protein